MCVAKSVCFVLAFAAWLARSSRAAVAKLLSHLLAHCLDFFLVVSKLLGSQCLLEASLVVVANRGELLSKLRGHLHSSATGATLCSTLVLVSTTGSCSALRHRALHQGFDLGLHRIFKLLNRCLLCCSQIQLCKDFGIHITHSSHTATAARTALATGSRATFLASRAGTLCKSRHGHCANDNCCHEKFDCVLHC